MKNAHYRLIDVLIMGPAIIYVAAAPDAHTLARLAVGIVGAMTVLKGLVGHSYAGRLGP